MKSFPTRNQKNPTYGDVRGSGLHGRGGKMRTKVREADREDKDTCVWQIVCGTYYHSAINICVAFIYVLYVSHYQIA